MFILISALPPGTGFTFGLNSPPSQLPSGTGYAYGINSPQQPLPPGTGYAYGINTPQQQWPVGTGATDGYQSAPMTWPSGSGVADGYQSPPMTWPSGSGYTDPGDVAQPFTGDPTDFSSLTSNLTSVIDDTGDAPVITSPDEMKVNNQNFNDDPDKEIFGSLDSFHTSIRNTVEADPFDPIFNEVNIFNGLLSSSIENDQTDLSLVDNAIDSIVADFMSVLNKAQGRASALDEISNEDERFSAVA